MSPYALKPILAVFHKELRELLRDRRAIITTFVLPTMGLPLLLLIIGGVSAGIVGKAMSDTSEVALVGAGASPAVRAELGKLGRVTVVAPTPADWRERVAAKSVRAAVELPDDFDARLARGGEPVPVKIHYHEGDLRSKIAASALEGFFGELKERVVLARLAAAGQTPALLRPVDTRRVNVAPPEKVQGSRVGSIAPYLIILLCLTGAMYPAFDLTAGEKERGTMETLLSSPVSRRQIAVGKFLTVTAFSLGTALFSMASMTAWWLLGRGAMAAIFGPKASGLADLTISPASVGAVVVLLVPLAVFFSAGLLALGVFARSSREAQTYAAPLVFAAIIPAVIGLLPGMELNWKIALIPVLNVSMVSREVFGGEWPWPEIALTLGSISFFAALALWGTTQMFRKETVLFRA